MRRIPKVFLVNPSNKLSRFSFVTPLWQYVLAAATPGDLVGDPIIIDQSLEPFNPMLIEPGDIVGISIMTDNCLAGYRTLRAAKERGAVVVFGGVHSTIFPEEPIQMGADAVVKGDGDLIWKTVVQDVLDGKIKKLYDGGQVPGELLLGGRWDLLAKSKYLNRYLIALLQTVRGCPKNCTFCSVWVVDGRDVRLRPSSEVIREANALTALGFPIIGLAEDNATPGVIPAIEYEMKHGSPARAKKLECVREARLELFDAYAKGVTKIPVAFTQMTSEAAHDLEYLDALHNKMGVRGALIGVESFTQEGLASARKEWNPVGAEMAKAIKIIQEHGVWILSSIICGLPSDTPETMATMRQFAKDSGTLLAQFPIYYPIPGTVDFLEMAEDLKARQAPSLLLIAPKHKTQLLYDKYWLDPKRPRVLIKHPTMTPEVLTRNADMSWDEFYARFIVAKRAHDLHWGWIGGIILFFASIAFRKLHGGQGGLSSDSVRGTKTSRSMQVFLFLAIRLSRRASIVVPKPVMTDVPAALHVGGD